MTKAMQALAVGALALPFMAGCATKGWVRTQMTSQLATQRASIDSSITSNIETERMARMAGDSANAANIASLRQDLDSLRTQYGARITAMENGLQFIVPVHFAFDDANVRDQDRMMLDRFAQVVGKHYNGSVITVEGFADPAGSRSYNLELSRRRAEGVRSYLATQGLSDAQLRAVGYGEARQVVQGAERDQPGAEENRRVVFVVETAPQTVTGVASITPE